MTTLKVEEMHCEKCVERITNALRETEIEFEISLSDKTVTIDGCEHCVETVVAELADLGFSAVIS